MFIYIIIIYNNNNIYICIFNDIYICLFNDIYIIKYKLTYIYIRLRGPQILVYFQYVGHLFLGVTQWLDPYQGAIDFSQAVVATVWSRWERALWKPVPPNEALLHAASDGSELAWLQETNLWWSKLLGYSIPYYYFGVIDGLLFGVSWGYEVVINPCKLGCWAPGPP